MPDLLYLDNTGVATLKTLIGEPTDEQVTTAVHNELVAHPEWTTTVQDGSITGVKIADNTIPDAKLAQTGGVLETVDEITDKMQLVTVKSKNLCREVNVGYMGTNGVIDPTATGYRYTNHIPVSSGDRLLSFGTYGGVFRLQSLRFVAAFDSDNNAVSSAGTQDVNEYVVPEGISSVVLTLYNTSTADFMVTNAYVALAYEPYFEPQTFYVATSDFKTWLRKDPCAQVRGALTDGGTLEIAGRSAIKDGQTIVFKGHLMAFNAIALNFDTTAQITNYVQVDDTNVTIKNSLTAAMSPVAHGLTIENDICIEVEFSRGSGIITVTSNGESFTTTVPWHQAGGSVTQPQIKSDGTTCDSAMLSVAYPAATRKTWYFGDSYISTGDAARWPHYLGDLFENILLSGSSGAGSDSSVTALTALLAYGTPDVAVFATGMNDGGDTTTTQSTSWKNRMTQFISLCKTNGVTPILCTIPTVSTVNNEQKNAWVRASGYRYIDFAAAVGANANGEWYAGMLSSDNVHPSAKGAKALYSQVLADLPEIFIPA